MNNLNNLKVLLFVCIALTLSFNSYSQKDSNDCRVLLYQISKHYEGDCKNGLADGKGKAVGIDTYEGKFKKGLPNGTGTYTWKNGNIYTGEWKKGKRSGKGTLYSAANNEKINAYWKNDEFVKEIKIPEYKIEEKYNVQSVSVRKINETGNKVTISLKRDGRLTSNQEDINIVVTNGVLSESQYFLYNWVTFPWNCNIRFTTSTRLSAYKYNVNVKVKIDKPGEWEITVNY